jgi:sigma-B regulation protein RsbU (phosphoserine phosphatase)
MGANTDMTDRTAPRGSEIQYRLLFEISQQISRTIDLQETLTHLLRLLRSILEYDAAGIFVLNRNVPFGPGSKSNMIAGMATVGFGRITERTDPMLRSGKGIVGHVIRTGETVIASDVSRDPHYIEGRHQTRSEIAVPIVSNAQVIGALNLESDRLDAFTAADAEMLEAFAVAAAISIEKAVLHRQVIEKHLIEQQLRIAREVQASLLPAEAPVVEGYDIAGLNLPAWDIGGDYFDYFPLVDGRLGVVIADVAGKGVPAALLMATFRAALRSEVRKNLPIPAIISDVHGTLVESMDTSRFVSAVYGVLDPRTGTFTYVNCGHNPPILQHAGGDRELLSTGNAALGVFGEGQVAPATVRLERGDTLLLYTDGVVETTDASESEFGDIRVARVLSDFAARSAGEIIGALVEATRAFAGRERYDDDFTLVVVKRRDDRKL